MTATTTAPPVGGALRPTSPDLAGITRAVASHGPFVAVLLGGVLLRAVLTWAVRPGLEFAQDSFEYLWFAAHPGLRDVVHPEGYPVVLRVLRVLGGGHLLAVPIAQHLLGLGMGVALYALARRLGAGRWAGAVAAAPVLLGGYQVVLEQYVLSDVVFEALVVAAFAVALWPARPGPATAAVTGLLIGAAVLTRTVGMAAVPVLVGYVLVRRSGWRSFAALVATTVLVVGGYAAWFAAGTGRVGLEAYDGYFLAGRIEPVADCRGLVLPPPQAALCPRQPAGAQGPDWYTWDPSSPLRNPSAPAGEDRNAVARSYALAMLRHRPVAYARSVAADTLSYLVGLTADLGVPGRDQTWLVPTSVPPATWAPEYPPSDPYVWEWSWPGNVAVTENRTLAVHGFGEAHLTATVHGRAAVGLRWWERVAYLPGVAVLAAALAAAALLVRSLLALRVRDGARRDDDRLVHSVAALVVGGSALLLLTTATAGRDPRYLLPVGLLVWPAGVLAWGMLRAGRLPVGRHAARTGERPPVTRRRSTSSSPAS